MAFLILARFRKFNYPIAICEQVLHCAYQPDGIGRFYCAHSQYIREIFACLVTDPAADNIRPLCAVENEIAKAAPGQLSESA